MNKPAEQVTLPASTVSAAKYLMGGMITVIMSFVVYVITDIREDVKEIRGKQEWTITALTRLAMHAGIEISYINPKPPSDSNPAKPFTPVYGIPSTLITIKKQRP